MNKGKFQIQRKWDSHSEYSQIFAEWDNVMNWCVEQFGVPGNRWSSESTMYDTIFKFNNQEDANFFFLKWGQ